MVDSHLNNLINSIDPIVDIKLPFRKEFKNKELMNGYFICLEDIYKGLMYKKTYIYEKKPNWISRFVLWINGAREKHGKMLKENVIKYTKLEEEIGQYIYNNFNSLDRSLDVHNKILINMNEIIGCYSHLWKD